MVRPGSPIWDAVLDVPVEISIKDSKKVNPDTQRPFRNCYLDARTGDPLPKGVEPLPGTDVPMPVGGGAATPDPGDDVPFAASVW